MAEAAAVMAAVGTAVALIVDVVASVVATTGLWWKPALCFPLVRVVLVLSRLPCCVAPYHHTPNVTTHTCTHTHTQHNTQHIQHT